jgi:alkanesulfonate monooxygenase SsuD/methylene tetrahydromethanopterin reductase-like flavin-dependent oxidoreductase (luciferase family)
MKLSVEFPSVSYKWGPGGIIKLAQAVEQIGFDQLDMFDHVVMGYPTDTRAAPIYPPQMPIMEAIVMLSFIAAATDRIGLGTEVLVLPGQARCWRWLAAIRIRSPWGGVRKSWSTYG